MKRKEDPKPFSYSMFSGDLSEVLECIGLIVRMAKTKGADLSKLRFTVTAAIDRENSD